jgi:hypothetical protein
MYMPQTFLSLEVLEAVASQFEWPAPYTFEDDLPDGIVMVFPACHLYFKEGFEGDMQIVFLEEDTGRPRLTLDHALLAARATSGEHVAEPVLFKDRSGASLDKVKHGLHDLCALVLAYLRPCLLGDFGWVADYDRVRTGDWP